MLLSRWRALQLSTWEASGALAPASQQAPTHQPLLATLLRLLLPQGASQRCYGTSQSRETRIVPSQQVPRRPSAATAASAPSPLDRFLGDLAPTPPVSDIRGLPLPTALSWLRRRGPPLPHVVLHRLFRQRQVRLYDPKSGRVARVRESRLLHPGQLLLFPSNVAPPAGSSPGADRTGHQTPLEQHQHQHRGQGQGHRATVQRGLTSAASVTAAAAAAAGSAAAATALTPERVRRWVLGVHPGVVFVNKPAGVLVHGRAAGDAEPPGSGGRAGGGAAALDDVLRRALRYGEHDEPRLVHRLDAQASGVMAVARNADAAAWLAAAFAGKARQALADVEEGEQEAEEDGEAADGDEAEGDEEEEERPAARRREHPQRKHKQQQQQQGISPELYVRRMYWAFVAGNMQPRSSGRIRYPVAVDGRYYPAVSSYRVKATGCGVTWLELMPETGRKHQLRVHCARRLGLPIVGDTRYGYRGLPPDLRLRELLPEPWWEMFGRRRARTEQEQQQQQQQQGGEGWGAANGAALQLPPPIMLHARRLVVGRPGRSPLVAEAPLPRYMREMVVAAGWQLPREG